MAQVSGRTFENQKVVLDGHSFQNCRFKRCQLIYRGGASPSIVDCVFQDTRFAFEGPAIATLGFLSSMYHGLGESGVRIVEDTFNEIRMGPRAAKAAAAGEA